MLEKNRLKGSELKSNMSVSLAVNYAIRSTWTNRLPNSNRNCSFFIFGSSVKMLFGAQTECMLLTQLKLIELHIPILYRIELKHMEWDGPKIRTKVSY